MLYVAMTRARDRLIMTYAARNLERDCENLRLRLKYSEPLLVAMDADCPGVWILAAAMIHSDNPLQMRSLYASNNALSCERTTAESAERMPDISEQLQKSLEFLYPHRMATTAPSKQTATQLKGRNVDYEAAEATQQPRIDMHIWRTPSFVGETVQGRMYGTTMHTVMQYLRLDRCEGYAGISEEIRRLAAEGYISEDQAAIVNVNHIDAFFQTDIGSRFRNAKQLLREFKFSVLDDAEKYNVDVSDEQVLLQGVVDCAIIDDDGITIVDFKTDQVNNENLQTTVERYRAQICVYADALSRIYQLPIKDKYLYFFELNRLVKII